MTFRLADFDDSIWFDGDQYAQALREYKIPNEAKSTPPIGIVRSHTPYLLAPHRGNTVPHLPDQICTPADHVMADVSLGVVDQHRKRLIPSSLINRATRVRRPSIYSSAPAHGEYASYFPPFDFLDEEPYADTPHIDYRSVYNFGMIVLRLAPFSPQDQHAKQDMDSTYSPRCVHLHTYLSALFRSVVRTFASIVGLTDDTDVVDGHSSYEEPHGDVYNNPHMPWVSTAKGNQCPYNMQWMPFMEYQGFPPVAG